jgi:hypothetical protein
MVVLASWSFNSFGGNTFEALISKVKVQSMMLHSTLPTGHILEKYTKHGYVPMRHQMRNGAKNISWYRGPFVPNKVDFQLMSSDKYSQYSSSDAALNYDQDTGLLDVSIAAAWELGKIMALNNQEFTKAMVTWNNDPVEDDSQAVAQTVKKSDLVQWLLKEEKTNNLPNQVSTEQYKPFPNEVKSYLKSLAKLEGLPLSYIIPDLKYISSNEGEANALTMFYLNPKWIWALLEGATSLSRYMLIDTVTQSQGIMNEVFGSGTITGFLFHSPIVSGWRGIEIKAYENEVLLDNGKKIRFERITPELFLGIFLIYALWVA